MNTDINRRIFFSLQVYIYVPAVLKSTVHRSFGFVSDRPYQTRKLHTMNVEGEQRAETKGWRKGLNKVGNWLAQKDNDNWLKDIRGNLSLVATVIATITFQSALNPPGGVRPPQETGVVACSEGMNPCPGESVLAYSMAEDYRRFLICNTICFISSSAVCLWLVSGLTLSNRFFNWLLSIGMCVTISSLALTYMYGAQMVTANPVWTTSISMFGIVILVWLALLGVVVVVHSLRLFVWILAKLIGKPKQ
ncbi:uncharacterized protein LOC108337675 isoform X2 [Vigna angularis]|uniref:uncharacterized protein LOC108337675 isoform X2 n=1 Tax=Phaseolus angularis TaxID=3914 RepID=UPI0022B2B311|nr:uncharacterized protein LOC108337675 isoform X2 [Vigna angularis]